MKKIYLSMALSICCICLQAQLKLGDNPKAINPASLLEMESTTKGLLLPRMTDSQIYAMGSVPAGMLVFSTTDSALYLRRDTGWAILALAGGTAVPATWSVNGNDIYNANPGKVGIGTSTPYSLLSNTSSNITASDGYGGGPQSLAWSVNQPGYTTQLFNSSEYSNANGLAVKVTSTQGTALDVSQGSNPLFDVKSGGRVGIGTNAPYSLLSNTSAETVASDGYGAGPQSFTWSTSQAGYTAVFSNSSRAAKASGLSVEVSSPGGSALDVSEAGNPLLHVTAHGNVGIGTNTPAYALDVKGDINYTGTLHMGVQYITDSTSLEGNAYWSVSVGCPVGTQLIGGGGGARDYNDVQRSITVNYSGPDPNQGNQWRILINNSGNSPVAILLYAICANVK